MRSRLERQRIDKWLWHARVVRTRESAAALVTAGHVRINGAKATGAGRAGAMWGCGDGRARPRRARACGSAALRRAAAAPRTRSSLFEDLA